MLTVQVIPEYLLTKKCVNIDCLKAYNLELIVNTKIILIRDCLLNYAWSGNIGVILTLFAMLTSILTPRVEI